MARTITLLVVFTTYLFSQINSKYGNYFPEYNLWVQDQSTRLNPVDIYSWSYVQISPANSIVDVMFIDSLMGWAAHIGNGAMRTTDGGFNWIQISFADTIFTTSYNGIYFVNPNTGWCVGGAVQIRKTTNGGVNWFKQTPPSVAGVLNGVYFWNENTGIAIGRKTANFNSFITRTTNSGVNWVEVVATTNNNNELSDQYWFNESTGWISGRDVLLYSTNGGLNYTNYYGNVPPTSNGANALLSVIFVNQQTGWLGGSNLDKKNIYKTTNAGANWVFQDNPVTSNPYVQINDMKFLSQDSGWAVHGTPFSGAIMFTTNAGTNWIIEDGSNTWFDCITYHQRHKAWCGASAGRMYYTYLTPPVGIENKNDFPGGFKLEQNYPNPFNPVTSIRFVIPAKAGIHEYSNVSLTIYNSLGKEIETLVNQELKAGEYEVEFDASNYSSGLYYYRLSSDTYNETLKMILIK